MPRPATVATRIDSMVTAATRGCAEKFVAATGARLKPISATMAPVTAGGITASSAARPAFFTMTPTRTSTMPAVMTTPDCAAMPCACVAVSGAMNAKDEPR